MSTVSSSSATVLLMTGLLSVGMAAMGLLYLQLSSKKMSVSKRETSAYDKSVASSTNTSEGRVATPVKSPVLTHPETANKMAEGADETFVTEASEPHGVAKDLLEIGPLSPMDEVAITSLNSEQSILDLLERPHTSTAKIFGSRQGMCATVEKSMASHPTTIDSTAIEGLPASPIKTPNGLDEDFNLAFESLNTSVEDKRSSPEKPVKPGCAVQEIDADLMKLSEDCLAVSETAGALTEELLHESLEKAALGHDEYVQVELTRSMMLPQSTPKLSNLEDTEAKNIQTIADSQNEETIVKKETVQTIANSQDEKGTVGKVGQTIASLQDENTINIEELVTPITALHDDESYLKETMVKTIAVTQNDELMVIKEINDESMVVEEIGQIMTTSQEINIEEEKHEQFYREPTKQTSVGPIDEMTCPPLPKSSNAQFASWEDITLSPDIKMTGPAAESVTPMLLDTPIEIAESSDPLLINVPAGNNEVLAKDTDASSPVSSGDSFSGKRHRNRSKKAKNKKKKVKNNQKLKS